MSRIMIVDDDFDILRYCESILAPRGHEIVISSEPEKALNTLLAHTVDLLIVDVVMPQVSGFDLLRSVKKIKHFGAPILMLTGRKAPQDVKMALELGATDYMVKPFDRDVFLAKIESILGMRARCPEVKFAEGTTNAKAEVTIPSMIVRVSEMGIMMRSLSYLDRGTRTKVNSPLFKEIGIECPHLRVVSCRPIEEDTEYHYEVFVSFIGLDDMAMKKIRRWISGSAILKRKAG